MLLLLAVAVGLAARVSIRLHGMSLISCQTSALAASASQPLKLSTSLPAALAAPARPACRL